MSKSGSDPGQLLRLISGVNRHLVQSLELELRPSGLSIEQFRILEALHAKDGLAMGEIAALVFVDNTTLTKIVDRMVANTLVYRAPDSEDRRRVLIMLAPRGRTVLGEIRGSLQSHQRELIGHLQGHETQNLRKLLLSFLDPA